MIAFARKVFNRPVPDSFYEWLFTEAPDLIGLLSFDRDTCIAMNWAFRRRYRIGNACRVFLETFDWYCMPEYRGSGTGVALMREFMNMRLPITAVGGSSDTLKLLPRLKWKRVADVAMFQLPLRGSLLRQEASPDRTVWTGLLVGFSLYGSAMVPT